MLTPNHLTALGGSGARPGHSRTWVLAVADQDFCDNTRPAWQHTEAEKACNARAPGYGGDLPCKRPGALCVLWDTRSASTSAALYQ